MDNHISRQGDSLGLQYKEGMDNIKARDISDTAVIKDEPQITMAMVKKIDQDLKH